MHFREDAGHELETLMQQINAGELAGALSLGEIDTMPDVGIPRFHNAAVVCLQRPATRGRAA